jgi:hypothetical protein
VSQAKTQQEQAARTAWKTEAYFPPKRWALSELHDDTTQKTVALHGQLHENLRSSFVITGVHEQF